MSPHSFESGASRSASAGAFCPIPNGMVPAGASNSACSASSSLCPSIEGAPPTSLSGALAQGKPDVISSTAATASSQPVAAASVRCMRRNATTLAVAAASVIQLTSVTVALKGHVMRSVYEEKLARASKNARMIVQGDARTCSALNFGKVCKALWPFKTAEALAAIVGCSVRAAAYEISGEREPSAQSVLAVIDAIIPKRERA